MRTPYSVGYYFERRVRAWLEDRGWVVFRTGGSRGPVDLVALKAGEVLLVQVKVDGVLSPRERQDLYQLSRALLVRVVLAYREGGELKWLGVYGPEHLTPVEMVPEKKRKEDYGDKAG